MQKNWITFVVRSRPFSVYVSTPIKTNVVWDEKTRSPQPLVACMDVYRSSIFSDTLTCKEMPVFQHCNILGSDTIVPANYLHLAAPAAPYPRSSVATSGRAWCEGQSPVLAGNERRALAAA